MLYILFMLIMLLPTLAGIGALSAKLFKTPNFGLALTILNGIFFCTIIWTVFAFFIPLSIYVEIVTLIFGILLFFYFKIYLQFWEFIFQNTFVFLFVTLIIVFVGSYYPFILDHFGYYVPTIKWLSEVGLVQGISNLDLLLGQMSFWHIFQAGFAHFADSFLRINVLVLIVYLIYILERKSLIHLVFLPFLLLFIQSPSTDLPVIVFSLIILNEILDGNKNATFLFTISVFVFALKPTMIWLPIFTFFYNSFILKGRSVIWLIPGVAFIILFFFKNFWTFGFPIFPVQLFDIGLPWKPNASLLQNSAEMALQKTYDMQYEFPQIQKFSYVEYIQNWILLDGIKGFIHISFLLTLLVFFVFAVRKKSAMIWFLFVSVLMKSVAVLLFSAQYRFFFDVFFIVFFILFYKSISKNTSILIFSLSSIIIAGFLSFPTLVQSYLPSFKLGNFITGFSSNQFIKPAHFEWTKYRTHQIGNLEFNVVDGYVFSFETPLPAISPQFLREDLEAGIFPQLKGKTLQEGFIWREMTIEEKKKLTVILKDFQN